ncbi:hypothetical protein [Aquimarina sp. 2304DJ70-9]|uniref:hypothetical protein n=1 Tax=Aquimarina penaris TaxID=3231044 RepID=UPI00346327C3
MNQRKLYIGLLAFTLLSCDGFILKKENKEEIVKEGLDKLNWNEVEQPPLFEICKEKPEEELEQCFQNTITKHIQDYLAQYIIKIKQPVNDTIWVPLLITKDSKIILEDFELPSTIEIEIPNLKDTLAKGIETLPKIEPAHTRSTPVTARYKLPIVIRIE